MRKQLIDRNKLREAIRRLPDEHIYEMLTAAIEMLPPSKLETLARPYINLTELVSEVSSKIRLIKEVRAFEKASLRGDYYESFMVDSHNSSRMSKGTRAWIAEFGWLLDRCVEQSSKKEAGTLEAFEICFGLLRHIDECLDDVIFFADEGGSWQVGVDWKKVLPAWFLCLHQAANAEDYARKVIDIVDEFVRNEREDFIAAAARIATPEQRKALLALRPFSLKCAIAPAE